MGCSRLGLARWDSLTHPEVGRLQMILVMCDVCRYWLMDCRHDVGRLPNVMVLFDDAAEPNGCLKVIRGSHRRGCLPARETGDEMDNYFTNPRDFELENAVPIAAPSGSVVFFDPHTVHGSEPNHTAESRRAIILTYQPGGYSALKSGEVRDVVTPPGPGAGAGVTGARRKTKSPGVSEPAGRSRL